MRSRWAFPLAAALALTPGCSGTPPEKPVPPEVKTALPVVRRVEVALPFVGRVEQARGVRMVALVEGRVTGVEAADGARVRAGHVVFRLGGPRVEARREELKTALRAARAGLTAARDRAEQAKRRAEDHLAQPGEVARARGEVAAAEGRAAAAEAALTRFTSALEVTAPRAGRFSGRMVSAGQNVRPGDLLGEILEPRSVRVTAEVVPDSRRVPRAGEDAVVQGGGGGPISVRVTAVQPVGGAAGTVRVWLEGRALSRLALGTVVRGHVVASVHEDAVTVPESAVVRDGRDRPLLFVGEKAPFEKRMVSTGESGADWIEITSGLRPGEPVVRLLPGVPGGGLRCAA